MGNTDALVVANADISLIFILGPRHDFYYCITFSAWAFHIKPPSVWLTDMRLIVEKRARMLYDHTTLNCEDDPLFSNAAR